MGSSRTIFGLTGGIACGKSEVASVWRQAGVGMVDCDLVAREVVEPGTEGFAEIVAAFGTDVVGTDGRLDRIRLAAKVFSSEPERHRLEAITHPHIHDRVLELVEQLKRNGHELICVEGALLFEAGLAGQFRPMVVVTAPESSQLSRLIARDGMSAGQATARMRSQMPVADKVSMADVVIVNDGHVETLRVRAVKALEKVHALVTGSTG